MRCTLILFEKRPSRIYRTRLTPLITQSWIRGLLRSLSLPHAHWFLPSILILYPDQCASAPSLSVLCLHSCSNARLEARWNGSRPLVDHQQCNKSQPIAELNPAPRYVTRRCVPTHHHAFHHSRPFAATAFINTLFLWPAPPHGELCSATYITVLAGPCILAMLTVFPRMPVHACLLSARFRVLMQEHGVRSVLRAMLRNIFCSYPKYVQMIT